MADKEYGVSKQLSQALGQMFSSNPIIRTKIVNKNMSLQGSAMKILKDVSTFYMTMLSNQSYDRFARYGDYCIAGNTIIATPEFECGYATIEQLLEKYPNGERFLVYGYNKETSKIEATYAHHPRFVKADYVIDVVLDDDTKITTTPDHKFMTRRGDKIEAQDLKEGQSLMPFYKTMNNNGYWDVKLNYIGNNRIGEHRLVAEITNKKLKVGEQVHHINSIRTDNRPCNLKILKNVEHLFEHEHEFTNEYAIEYNKQKWADNEYREKFGKEHSKFMSENNPERLNITFNDIKECALKNSYSMPKVMKELGVSKTVIENRLFENKIYNWLEFCNINGIIKKGSGAPRKTLTLDQIKEKIRLESSLRQVAEDLNVSHSFVKKILKINGYNSFGEFKEKVFYNHKVKAIIDNGDIQNVYNLTTDLGNFAILTKTEKTQQNGVVIFNCEMESTPELSAALNIYADECTTTDEQNRIINIKTDDRKIQTLLEEFFASNLNLNANLYHWTRNMCKYGDYFMLNNIIEGQGIVNTLMMPVNEVIREEGFDKNNPFAVRYRWQTRGNADIQPYEISHFRLTGRENFLPYGCCLRNSSIYTTSGVKEIKNIVKGDEIISLDLKTKKKVSSKVLDQVCSGTKQCYKIRTKHNEISMTKEHKTLVVRDGEFEYVHTDELKIGDLLVISKEHKVNQQIPINKSSIENCRNGCWSNINCIPDFVDEDFARLFGFMVGDGWIHNNSVCFALGVYPELNEFYEDILFKYSGRKARRTKSCETKKESTALVGSKMLSIVLRRMGFEGKARTKRLPSWIFAASTEIKKAFLQGLFDSDGSAFTDKWNCTRYCFELNNEELIKDIKCLVQCLGYKTGKICSRDRTQHMTEINRRQVRPNQPSYYFYYFESKNEQIKRHDLGLSLDEFITEPIISIEDDGEHEVYDIYVDHPDHNFIANGIVVHNSILEPARRIWRQLILLEDAMLVYRIVRAPERRVFSVEMGAASPDEEPLIIEKFRSNVTQQSIIDGQGRVEQRFNPMDMATDYYLPMRGGIGSKIENLPGGAFNGDIDDVEYIQRKLIAALHIPKAFLSFDESLCLSRDTKVLTLDNRSLTLPEIEKEILEGKNVYVYSNKEDGQTAVGKVEWCGKTKFSDKIYRITLDNGKYFDCTENHPIMMRDGTYKNAIDIQSGDSCMPYYERLAGDKCFCKGYKQVLNNKNGRWEYIHRISKQQESNLDIKGMIVHHIDYDKYNNNPDNLQLMNLSDHMSLHAKLSRNLLTEKSRIKLNEIKKTEEYRNKLSRSAKNSWVNRDDRRKIVSDTNIKLNKMGKMREIYNEILKNNPNWRLEISEKNKKERISIDSIIQIITGRKITLDELCKEVKLSSPIVSEIIKNSEYKTWSNLANKFCKTVKGRISNLNINDLKDIASTCETKREFYKKCEASRCAVENLFKRNNIDFIKWFENRNYNHKVVSIEIVEYNDWVWDLHVPEFHNFALEAGVYVHNSGKATLAQEDIRWARTVERVQKSLVAELTRLAMIHLYAKGVTNEDDLANFELTLTNPSNLSVLQRMEVWAKKLEVSRAALDSGLPNQWIQEQLFGFTKEEFDNNMKKRLEDAAFEAQYEKVKSGADQSESTLPEGEQETPVEMESPNLAGVGGEDLYKHVSNPNYEEVTGLAYVMKDIIDPLTERRNRINSNKAILKELKESDSLGKLNFKFKDRKSLLFECKQAQNEVGNDNSKSEQFAKFLK